MQSREYARPTSFHFPQRKFIVFFNLGLMLIIVSIHTMGVANFALTIWLPGRSVIIVLTTADD